MRGWCLPLLRSAAFFETGNLEDMAGSFALPAISATGFSRRDGTEKRS